MASAMPPILTLSIRSPTFFETWAIPSPHGESYADRIRSSLREERGKQTERMGIKIDQLPLYERDDLCALEIPLTSQTILNL